MELIIHKPGAIWDPLANIWDLRDEIDHAFDDYSSYKLTQTRYPAVDIYEEKNCYMVKAELPGMKQEDITVSIAENTLTLRGRRNLENDNEQGSYQRQERVHGEFYRSFRLPERVHSDKIKAKYRDGILEVEIPKSEKAKDREIAIKLG